ncbi:unnamed protein product [Cochlearia groenlandica]
MASIVMFLRALMSCRLTPKDEPEMFESSSASNLYKNVHGDENITLKNISMVDIEASRVINDHMDDDDEGFYWIIVKNHLLM